MAQMDSANGHTSSAGLPHGKDPWLHVTKDTVDPEIKEPTNRFVWGKIHAEAVEIHIKKQF